MELTEDLQAPEVDLSSQVRPEEVTGESRERIQTDRVIEYRLVDAEGLAGAGIYKVKTGDLIVRCDEEGVAQSTEPDPGQLYFHAPDYLLGFFLPDRRQLTQLLAQAGEGHVRVPLHRDVLSFPLQVKATLPSGQVAKELSFQLVLHEHEERAQAFENELFGRSAGLQQAWKNYRNAPFNTAAIVNGFRLLNPIRRQTLRDSRFRLFVSGEYEIQVLVESGFYGETRQWIYPDTGSIEVALSADARFTGRVVDSDSGAAISGVRVSLEPAPKRSRLGQGATGEDGTFSLHAMGSQPRTVMFKHPLYELAHRASVNPGTHLDVILKRLPPEILSGVVRTRGSGKLIAGANLLVYHSSGPPNWPDQGNKLDELCTVTDEHGAYRIVGMPKERGSLSVYITAEGFMPEDTWLDMVKGGELNPEMTPDTRERRLEAGVSSVLSGIVTHEDGSPAVGVDLRLTVDGKFWGEPGKGRATGGFPAGFDFASMSYAPGITQTDSKGAFALECAVPGLAKIESTDGQASFNRQVQLGKEYTGLTLIIRK
jgi:hypothetical protein